MKFKYLKKQIKMKKGFSLTDFILWLGLVGVVLAGIFLLYPQARLYMKVNDEKQNIAAIRTGIESLYAGNQNYSGINTTLLIKTGAIPSSLILNNSSIMNSFGGVVNVVAGTKLNGNKGFTITYPSVPSKECSRIVNSISDSYDEIGVGTAGNLKSGQNAANPTSTAVINSCASNSNNIIVGVY